MSRKSSRLFVYRLVVLVIVSIAVPTFFVFSLESTYSPIEEISSVTQSPDAFAIVSIHVSTDDQTLDWFEFDLSIKYYSLNGTSVPCRAYVIILGDGSYGDIGVSLSEFEYKEIVYFHSNDSWTIYEKWEYQISGGFPREISTETDFPYDRYISPRFCIWTNTTSEIEIRLVSDAPDGYVMSLSDYHFASSTSVWNEMNLGQRLFVGVPEMDPLMFRVSTYRNQTARLVLVVPLTALLILFSWLAVLTTIKVSDETRRLQILLGSTIGIFGTILSLTQSARGVSFFLLAGIAFPAVWLLSEIVGHLREERKKIAEKDKLRTDLI